MRVMWLLDSMPVDAAEASGLLPRNDCGWQDALLDCMRTRLGIQLLVAYPGPEPGMRTELRGVEFADLGPREPPGRIARVAKRWRPGVSDPAIVDECVRLVNNWGPDLIHIHGTESPLGLVAGRVDAPALVSIQGVLSVYMAAARGCRTPHVPNRSWLSEFMRGITPWHDARRLRAAATLERLVLRQCRYVAGRTAFDERVAAVLAPQASYMHVGEVLRNAFYGPRWEGGQERRGRIPVLCAIGSEYSRKGVDTAIEAVRILLDSGCKARLRVFGAKPDSTAARLAVAHAERLGISEMICLSGKLNAADVVAQLLAADVYLHPSRADNSPNALCEAMMLGVPCVASTAGGIPSLATDGQDALLVPPGDAYSLAGAVRTLLADGRLAARLSETARDRATARHDPETVREQLLAAYASTLATPASGGAGRHDVASDRCPS